jgi:hypothetical protein
VATVWLKSLSPCLDTGQGTLSSCLQEVRVRPRGLFAIQVTDTILRELSFGNFSETNQKRLTRDSPVDIYRARLPGNHRLVVSRCLVFLLMVLLTLYKYHIDVITEYGAVVGLTLFSILLWALTCSRTSAKAKVRQ